MTIFKVGTRKLEANGLGMNKNTFESLTLEQRADIDQRLLHAHFDLMPLAVVGNIFNALLMIIPFFSTVAPLKLGAIVAINISAAVAFLLFWHANHDHYREDTARKTWQATVTAFGLSLCWGCTIYYLMLISSAPQQAMLGMLAAGMMAAVTLTCATLPQAARAFIAPTAIGVFIAFAQHGGIESWVTIAFLLSYCVALERTITVNFDHHLERLIGQIRLTENAALAEENAATVRLLLNDFEEHSADWLWEVDRNGCILDPNPRFAQAAERPLEMLVGLELLALLSNCPERDILDDHLRMMRPFRDISVPLMVSGEQRWWSLSGHPFEGNDGKLRLRGVATDISATKNAEVKVAYMAHYDGLTDLPNRFLFSDTLNRALHRQKAGTDTAVLSLDLDHFKSINDTLGHPAGDALLQVVSRRIEFCLKERDIVARMGGDEFAILLTNVKDRSAIERVTKRILKAINEPIEIEGHQVVSAASIGIAIAPVDGQSAEGLMKNVDLALYSAKANGRNRYAFFEAAMDDAAQARRMVEIDLRGAMSRDELALHYQPLIDVQSGQTVAYEALLRWHHPERGLVMPDDFIPVAEETGLIVQLGEWVIRNAVAEAARWPAHLSVSINLSPLQIKSSSLIPTIVNTIAATEIEPSRIEFEITESVLMHETEVNLATLHRLHAIGVRIALDDFGTGYSSLNYLRAFPFDKIKIDRCFVEDVDSREDCQAIVRAVTGLASSLGMVTTAEGVENAEQLDQLRIEGCTQVQGFLFSKAVAVGDLIDLRTSFGGAARKGPKGEKLVFLPPAETPIGGLEKATSSRKRA